MNLPNNESDELSFRYESDASASFLTVACVNRASEYQCSMLGRNSIRCLIPLERIIKDGKTCFYYNITSRVPLSIYLKRKKLSKQEFLKFVFDISSALNDSYGYLLNASNFVFRQEQIYISPDTLEPALVYIPRENGSEDCEELKSFISELLLQHIQVAGFDSENIVHRILSAVRNEAFNLKDFVALVSELLYGKSLESGERQYMPPLLESKAAADLPGEALITLHGSKNKGGRMTLFMVFAVMLQFVLALTIYLCRGLIDRAGSNHTANYAAVLMIVLAIDVLVFKKLLAGRMIKLRENEEGHDGEQRPKTVEDRALQLRDSAGDLKAKGIKAGDVKAKDQTATDQNAKDIKAGDLKAGNFKLIDSEIKSNIPTADKDSQINELMPIEKRLKTEIPGQEALRPENGRLGAAGLSCKTELLGKHAKGLRVLRSTGKLDGAGDIIIDRDDFIIGRLEGHVDHVLHNNAIGKLHAELISRNGTSCVKDLNSMNGTFINDNRIESNREYELRVNDRLRLANSEYIFTFDS